MTEHRSLPLLLLLACAHVVLVPLSLSDFTYDPAPSSWHALALGLCAAQLGLLTVWLNAARSRPLPLVCTLAGIAVWGAALAPIVGFRQFMFSAALFMTQLSIVTQVGLLYVLVRRTGEPASEGRFRYQFSLRALMTAALIVCVVLGYPQWLGQLSDSHLPVFTITASSAVLVLTLIAIRLLRGVSALLPALLLLCGLACYVAGPSLQISAWWQLTRRGFAVEAGVVLASVLVLRIARWRLLAYELPPGRAKSAATLSRWITPAKPPRIAAP
jgi:hypothetical protein